MGADQAVSGEGSTGDGRKGKARESEQPSHCLGCWYIGITQQADVLEPQSERLHAHCSMLRELIVWMQCCKLACCVLMWISMVSQVFGAWCCVMMTDQKQSCLVVCIER